MRTKQLLLSIILFFGFHGWGQVIQPNLTLQSADSSYVCSSDDSTQNLVLSTTSIVRNISLPLTITYYEGFRITNSNFTLNLKPNEIFKLPFAIKYDSCKIISTSPNVTIGNIHTKRVDISKISKNVIIPNYSCYGSLNITIPKPSIGVFYKVENTNAFTYSSTIDTLTLQPYLESDTSFFSVVVSASVGSCSLRLDSAKVSKFTNDVISPEYTFIQPSCNKAALINLNEISDSNYTYSPVVYDTLFHYLYLYEYSKIEDGTQLKFENILVNDLPNKWKVYIQKSNRFCNNFNSYASESDSTIKYNNITKVGATDSLALINFVERYPDTSKVSWHDRSTYKDGSSGGVVSAKKTIYQFVIG